MGKISVAGCVHEESEFMKNLDMHRNNLDTEVQHLQRECDARWAEYQAVQQQRQLVQLKAVYVEALSRGMHIAWAEGAAEKMGLTTESDEELDAIKGLFRTR